MPEGLKIQNILIIDDDATITTLVKKLLESNGYTITASNEAEMGLEEALKNDYDLIILDVMMPIINGFNLCKLIKQEESKKHIPIILLTSRDQIKDIEIGLEMGAEAYLVKPVNTDELIKTIKVIESADKN